MTAQASRPRPPPGAGPPCAPPCSRAPRWRPRAWAASCTWWADSRGAAAQRPRRSSATTSDGPLAPRALDAGRAQPRRRGGVPRRRLRARRLPGRGDLRRGRHAVPLRPAARPVVAAAGRPDRARRAGGRRRRRQALRGRRRQLARGRAPRRLESYDFSPPPLEKWARHVVAREHLAGAVSGGAFYVSPDARPGRATSRSSSDTCPAHGAGSAFPRWEGAWRHRRGHGPGPDRGGGGEEQAGTIREVEEYDPRPQVAPAAGHAHAAPRARRRVAREPRLHDRGGPDAGVRLLAGDRSARLG